MANNPSRNAPSKDQPPPPPPPTTTPTVQIPAPLLSLDHLPQPQYHSPKPSSSSNPSGVKLGVQSPTQRTVQSPTGRHPSYRGIRSRSGKWVSEIREPRKTTRIWLGTYPTPEMAATAYDVAAIALKGPDTDLNFPDSILSYPKAATTSANDIRAAAAAAAASRLPTNKHDDTGTSTSSKESTLEKQSKGDENEGTTMSSSNCMEMECGGEEFIDEEELLNFPNLMVDMAGGMLVSPPTWINSPPSDDSPDNSDVESLWTYT